MPFYLAKKFSEDKCSRFLGRNRKSDRKVIDDTAILLKKMNVTFDQVDVICKTMNLKNFQIEQIKKKME